MYKNYFYFHLDKIALSHDYLSIFEMIEFLAFSQLQQLIVGNKSDEL